MRVSIQTGSNEVVIRGDANFVSKMAYAVEVYEGKRESLEVETITLDATKEKKHHFKDDATMLKTLEKARAAKKKIQNVKVKQDILPSGKKRPKKHRAPRWTDEEDKKLMDFVNDENNYLFKRGKVVIHQTNAKKLARDLRRTTKAVNLRMLCEKQFRDVIDHMKTLKAMKRAKTGGSSWGWS